MMCETAEKRASRNGGKRRWSAKIVGKRRIIGVNTRIFRGFSGIICLSFRGRFGILLEKRPIGVAKLRYMMIYGKSQIMWSLCGNQAKALANTYVVAQGLLGCERGTPFASRAYGAKCSRSVKKE